MMMAQWNEQSAQNNNLKASDIDPAYSSGSPKLTTDTDQEVRFQNMKIEMEIRQQNF
jgi:hypothetical protein